MTTGKMDYVALPAVTAPLPHLKNLAVFQELEAIMLSEISQVVKDRYHVISLMSGF